MKRIVFIAFVFGQLLSAKAQENMLELLPSAIFPTMHQTDYYYPGWALNANFYHENYRSFALYGGAGIHHLFNRSNESGLSPFFGLQGYYGGQFKFLFNDDAMDISLGGEAGWMFRIYVPNSFSANSSVGFESSLGVAPLVAWNWRPWDGFLSFGFQTKYSIYFSLDGGTYIGGVTNGIYQWVQPAIAIRFHL